MKIRFRKKGWSVEQRTTAIAWSDQRLVRECLRGNEEAWSALIDKYKNLIYSVPIKYRFSPDDAADIFQAVCLELFSELPNLRKSSALRSWLMTVTAHKCFHWKQRQQRYGEQEDTEADQANIVDPQVLPEEMVQELEREQTLREALSRLPARCQTMIRLLFYEDPPRPYQEIARRLGLATGSIGFIRERCLKRLRLTLEQMGF